MPKNRVKLPMDTVSVNTSRTWITAKKSPSDAFDILFVWYKLDIKLIIISVPYDYYL